MSESDVHCPVWIVFSCKGAVITKYNDFDNVVCERSKYVIENNVIYKWDEYYTYLRTGLLAELPGQSCHGFNGRA